MVRIITDSAADFEAEEQRRLNIACIPVFIRFGEAEYRENEDLPKEMFYELLECSREFPKTGQPSIYEFIDAIDRAKAAGDDAIIITMSSALSGTHQTALSARMLAGYERCHVIDSRNATAGQRLLVEYAARLRDRGERAEEIVRGVEALRARIRLFACPDTLEYLQRGGRLSRTASLLGNAASVKPVIQVSQSGEVAVMAKMLGKQRGMRYLAQQVSKQPPAPDFPVYVMYTHIRENAEKLAELLRREGVCLRDDPFISVGASIGSHFGPNGFGVVYVAAKDGETDT